MKHFGTKLLCAATLVVCANSASAAHMDFDVMSMAHSLSPTDTGLDTGISLDFGEVFSVTADASDFWSLGEGDSRSINADGDSEPTGAPEFGFYADDISGQSFIFGSLVGRIGSGEYFLVGTDFSGTANASGNLFLLNWDLNDFDNSGSITASVTYASPAAVPIPATLPLLSLAFGALGMVSRRRKTS